MSSFAWLAGGCFRDFQSVPVWSKLQGKITCMLSARPRRSMFPQLNANQLCNFRARTTRVFTRRVPWQVVIIRNPLADNSVSGQGTHRGPLKVASICDRLQSQRWTDTSVQPQAPESGKTAKSLMLSRDDRSFPLIAGESPLFYVLHAEDDEVEFIHVERIYFGLTEAAKDDKTLLISGGTRGEWCVDYKRVRSTEQALELATPRDYAVKTASGRNITSIGKTSLRKLLKERPLRLDDRLLFHKGDYPFSTCAKYIVGFVAWDTLPLGRPYSSEDRKRLLNSVNKAMSSSKQQSKPSMTINSLDDLDWVYCGVDFSEPDFSRSLPK